MPRENDKVFLHASIENNIPTIPSLSKIEQERQNGGFVMWRLNSGPKGQETGLDQRSTVLRGP